MRSRLFGAGWSFSALLWILEGHFARRHFVLAFGPTTIAFGRRDVFGWSRFDVWHQLVHFGLVWLLGGHFSVLAPPFAVLVRLLCSL